MITCGELGDKLKVHNDRFEDTFVPIDRVQSLRTHTACNDGQHRSRDRERVISTIGIRDFRLQLATTAETKCDAARPYLRQELYRTRSDIDRKSTRLNSSHSGESRMPSSA